MTPAQSIAVKAFNARLAALSPLVGLKNDDSYLYSGLAGASPFAGAWDVAQGSVTGFNRRKVNSAWASLDVLQWEIGNASQGAQFYATKAGVWTDQIGSLFAQLVVDAHAVLVAFNQPGNQIDPGFPPPAPLPPPTQ